MDAVCGSKRYSAGTPLETVPGYLVVNAEEEKATQVWGHAEFIHPQDSVGS